MRDFVASGIGSVARDPLTLIFAGLGISFAPYEYVGGLFLALAGASVAMLMSSESDKKSYWFVMLTAVFVSHVAAMTIGVLFYAIPIQLTMAIAGFGSRYIARIALRVFGLLEERGDKIADRIVDRVLPDDDEPKK